MYFLQNFVSHFPRPSFHCRFFHKRGGGGEKHEEEDLEETGGSANGSGGGWVEGARQGRSLFFSFSSLLPSFCGFYTHTHTQRNSPPFHCWCRQSSTWIRRNFGLRRVHNLVSNSGALLPTLLCSSLLSASATAGSYESSIFSCRKETSIYLSFYGTVDFVFSARTWAIWNNRFFFSYSRQSADVCKAPRRLRANRMFDSVLPCACVTRANNSRVETKDFL